MTEYVRHPVQPTVTIKLLGGIYMRETLFLKAGMIAGQHAHAYDHISYLVRGAVDLFADGEPVGRFYAPEMIAIQARVKHRFEIIEDGTVVTCIHNADRNEADDVVLHDTHELLEE